MVRNAGLIRPLEGGAWQGGKHVTLTTLGRIVVDQENASKSPRTAVGGKRAA